MRRNGQHVASANSGAGAQQPVPFAAVLGGAGRGANAPAARASQSSGGGRGAGAGGGLRSGRGGGSGGVSAAAAAAAAAEDVCSGGEEEDDEDEEGEQKKPGRRKISIQFIEDKSKRHITFSKRKAGVIKKAKELSLLTGAQVLLIVTSETGNMYEFATPKFNKVLETFKTWYRASAKDSKRIESAVGLQLKQEEPALVEVEGVLNDDTGDEEVDAASRRRISALVHVASTAEAELLEHDEMAKAAWSHAPDGVKRPRALEDYDQAAHKRPRPEQGVAGGLTGSEPSAAEQQALMQKWMIEHAFVLQKMAQAYGPDQQAAGESRQGGDSELMAKGWNPKDKLPMPASGLSPTSTAPAGTAHTHRQKMVASLDKPAHAIAAAGKSALGSGGRSEAERSAAVGSSSRPASPIRALATRRKAVMHRLPTWVKARKMQPGGEEATTTTGKQDTTATVSEADAAGGGARPLSPRDSEVELLASLRNSYPAQASSSSGVVIPRLIERS